MSKLITYVPLSSVERIELRVTNCRKTLSQVKAETKAHYVLNGGMWNPDGTPCPLLKVGGAMLSGTPWRPMGYAWDKGPDIHMTSEYEGAANFIAVTALISSGEPVDKPSYGSAQGGKRGRSAIGLRGGSLALYCSSDGADAATPETLRDELAGLGWASAVMLDGGGSSQCDFGGERITASRKVHNWICVWLKQGGQKPPEQEDKPMSKHTVCLDPGHGPGNVNGSPDGTYKEWEFTWDMAQRIKPLLEAQGVGVVLTKTADNYPSLTERANISNKSKPDCFVSIHTNAYGEGGWSSASGLLDGAPFGWNLGYGFGDTSAATENALIYNGRLHKLDHVTFEIPMKDRKEDYLSPWRFTSSDGRFEMQFRPVLDRAACTDFKLLKSDQHQVFGTFTGTAVLDDGSALSVRDFFGFAEKVENKW